MKFYLTSLLLFSTLLSSAQQPKVNNIKQVKTLNIYGNGNKTVIGKLIVNQTLETKIFHISSYQTKDTLGIYTTTINLGNNENIPLFGGNFSLQFDNPVISVDGRCTGMNISTSIDAEKKSFTFKAGQINRPYEGNILVSFEIKSNQKTLVTLNGVDGQLKN